MLNNIGKFNFSFAMASKVKENLQEQLSTVESRIEKIVDHFTLNDAPILRFILNMNPDRDDLKKLSKALDRLSDLVQLHSSLSSKMAVVSTAEDDPNWFALAFGDFEEDVDKGIQDIFKEQ
jgi:hypothetical protein